MAIPKVMGIETEYGVLARGEEDYNPILASSLLINSFASPRVKKVRWDYEEENPLRDARGFERPPADAPLEDKGTLVSVILDNGARYYVDHAHPEYSTPECTNAYDLVVHDRAGERVLQESLRAAAAVIPPGLKLFVYKNNSDGKGNSYGCHENYLVARETPFPAIVRLLTPFLVTRQIFCGAGKMGHETTDDIEVPYQISQRADFFEVEVGLETTFKRPIINTRDEPHADPDKYRRLHVIVGDANLSEVATFLKAGTTALVLQMIEDGFITADLSLDAPVGALRAVSHDPSCRAAVQTAGGRTTRAVDLQWEFFEWAKKYLDDKEPDAVTARVMTLWESVLEQLEADPMLAAARCDWVAKLRLLESYRERHGLSWDDPRLAMLDLQYHDIRPDKGLYYKLASEGHMELIAGAAEVEAAIDEPPADTRAWFRGKCLQRFAPQITTASWDSVVFDVGADTLKKVPMMEPLRGTRAATEELFEVSDASELLDKLQAHPAD